jgi:hypothetical protein
MSEVEMIDRGVEKTNQLEDVIRVFPEDLRAVLG